MEWVKLKTNPVKSHPLYMCSVKTTQTVMHDILFLYLEDDIL